MLKIRKNQKIYLITAAIIILSFVLIGISLICQKPQMLTDKKEYKQEESLRVKIQNNLINKSICFSSCYPYYLEEKTGGKWSRFEYSSCDFPNVVENCIEPKKTKAFEIILPAGLKEGVYRIVSGTCINCAVNSEFKETKWIRSNEFVIK